MVQSDQAQGHVWEIDDFVHQPGATGRRAGTAASGEIGGSPVIMIAGDAVHRTRQPLQGLERLVEMTRLLNEIAGEADEVRGQSADQVHGLVEACAVALVMDVGEVHPAKLASGEVWMRREGEVSDADPVGFNADGVGGNGGNEEAQAEKGSTPEPDRFSQQCVGGFHGGVDRGTAVPGDGWGACVVRELDRAGVGVFCVGSVNRSRS